jgi:phenylpyruvate tautomerase PptA (4-oxalocrotonate tautomerase family)
MPFINVKTNVSISPQKEESLKAAFGKAITCVPGKSENWLMVGFEPDCRLWFKGSSEPVAMVEVSVFGSSSADAYSKLTSSVSESLCAELGLKKDRIFVRYAETPHWGWNGSNF